MSLEDDGPVGGPPSVPLKEYIERIFHEHRLAHEQRHDADKEAIKQAREVVDHRLEKLNELRAEVQEDRAGYVTKTQFEAVTADRERRLRALEEAQSRALTQVVFETYKEDQRKAKEKEEKEKRAERKVTLWSLAALAVSVVGLILAAVSK